MSLASSAPPRPVLLNKTTNALLSPRKHNLEPSMGSDDNFSKQVTRNHTPSSPIQLVGKKRTIDQVDVDQHRPSTATSSFNSQNRREDEFYIYDESTHSSMDIDKETSFLQYSSHNKVSDSQEQAAEKGCSQESTSISSLLNLSFESESGNHSNNRNINNAKRNSPLSSPNAPQKATRDQTISFSSSIPTDPEARKLFIQQKAGLLREKVQTAMKNIRDYSEIDRRIKELEAKSRQTWNASSTLGQHANQQATPSSSRSETRPDLAPGVQQGSSIASLGQNNGQKNGDHGATPTQQNMNQQPQVPLPSQPARNNQPVQPQNVNNAATVPVIPKEKTTADRKVLRVNHEIAVDGLLRLMKTTSEYDALDEWTGP
ncbi:hypothetical protein H112_07771 [Trichophyton rubrum D6]|uniref:Uncharacterized protein n=2 Tax=Trichophyton rubrum TaxID=5551 RepID=A0A178ETV5_TRIRU|nr:hypothetical protein H100_07796 [Trichophyton rubrum MR850]EZF37926.1 hypothetical protein H102_07759 [Trichophyton rubrum CBS 100081]EZF48562.1 hypothetical protein H103_07784 [Trichophyton rubrum CBS 288.86]EZF59203.1 hypothetical protein H104_07732 [Trichophyton rubrum CBS 289.86]EZF80591.1 hypothetical protein H110_07781 [Trichophyton rubrum MR1448]EZG12731.1 hypothetical protein H107_07921 [Trichophyton rubrum CBS 202.88]KDB29768.1 hypothetical protein H112_07771 [Trichophyton rubrum 